MSGMSHVALRIKPYKAHSWEDPRVASHRKAFRGVKPHTAAWRECMAGLVHDATQPRAPVELLLMLARAYVKQRHLEQAYTCLHVLLRRAPGMQEARSMLGLVCCRLGQYEEGRLHLQIAISLAPGDEVAWGRLATCFHDQGKLEPAISALMRQVEINPGNAAARRHLMRLLDETDPDD